MAVRPSGLTTGQALVRVNGVIDAGGGSFANLTSIPTNLRIESSYTGNQGVALGGGNNAFFTLYAPGTDVQLKGGGTIFGAVVGKTLSTSGVTALHYDNAPTRAGWTIWSIWGSFFGLPIGHSVGLASMSRPACMPASTRRRHGGVTYVGKRASRQLGAHAIDGGPRLRSVPDRVIPVRIKRIMLPMP